MSNQVRSNQAQFVRNVLFGSVLHFVVVIAGFIVPRQISDSLGQNALGIWDLGWVTLQYVAMGSLGIEGALTRWVSVTDSSGEFERIPKYTTAAFVWQSLVSILAIIIFSLFAYYMPSFIELESAEAYQQAQTVIVLMGCALVFKLMGNVYGSVITGVHRFDIQHSIEGGTDFLLAILLVTLLLFGGDLEILAAMVLLVEMIVCSLRFYYARRLCAHATLNFSAWEFPIAKEMLSFGVKNLIVNVPQMLVVQTVAITLASVAGPAMLSVLNRGLALVRFANKFVLKISIQFLSLAGRDVGQGHLDGSATLLVDAGKFGAAAAFPLSIGLMFFGDFLMRLWMGPEYANNTMMIILVLGSLLPATLVAVQYSITGLNQHGELAKLTLFATLASLGLAMAAVFMVGWNTVNAALAIAIGWTVGKGFATLYFLFRHLKVPPASYCYQTLVLPLLCNLPLIAACAITDQPIEQGRYVFTLTSLAIGGLLTLFAYWAVMLTPDMRSQLLSMLRKKG